MPIVISGSGSSIPSIRTTNDDLARRIETTDEWIRSHTGIGCRHFAEDGQVTSDLAADAARKAMAKAGVTADQIDIIVLATATPDYLGFPSTACIVQEKIGAVNAAAFDLTAGCTGFIYALDVASGMLQQHGRTRALVIGAETLSRIIDWEDRASCVLFGDGSGAVVIEKTDSTDGRGLQQSWLRAKGSGAKSLILTQPERTKTFVRDGDYTKPNSIYMDGKAVYMFAVKAITDIMEELVKASGIELTDFKWIVPHQANLRIVQAAAKRFGLPESHFYMNIEEYANTSAASIPIALDEMAGKGLLNKGDLIMIMGFGAGLTYGGCIIRW